MEGRLNLSRYQIESIFIALCKKYQRKIDEKYGIVSEPPETFEREEVLVEPALLENIADFCEQIIKKAKKDPSKHYIMVSTAGRYDIDKLINLTGDDLRNYTQESMWVASYVSQDFYDEENRNDTQIVMEIVKQNGRLLEYAGDSLKDDPQIVLEAIKNDGTSYEYASKRLQKGKELLFTAMKGLSLGSR